eukprot:5074590-Pleurochrysis_carterae.AAC.1
MFHTTRLPEIPGLAGMREAALVQTSKVHVLTESHQDKHTRKHSLTHGHLRMCITAPAARAREAISKASSRGALQAKARPRMQLQRERAWDEESEGGSLPL